MNVAELKVDIERVESHLDGALKEAACAVEALEVFLGDRPVQERNGEPCHFERHIETRASFGVASEFLILDSEVVIRFTVVRIFVDLLQTECEIEMLLGSDAFFASHFSIVMKDSRKGTELETRRQTSRVDDFVNDAVEANL